ncbi:MAG: hypothetical protein IPL79_16500 [Myxococcales bacterium]|nr:hypothetical protein [Myxococcales bacterium]
MSPSDWLRVGVLLLATAHLAPSAAMAQPSTPASTPSPTRTTVESGKETPWSKGVSTADRATAKAKLEAGNTLFIDNRHRDALAEYEAALAAWDHPAIHFNAARACIALERTLEALDHLDQALRWGEAPFDAATFREATTYQKLLTGQVATTTVSCGQPDTTVTLNGDALLTCPGEKVIRVKPGRHAFVGTRAGYLPKVMNEPLVPGENPPLAITLQPIGSDRETVIITRWATWKPWTVLASGVVIAGVGTGLLLQSRDLFVDYRDRLEDACGITACEEDPFPELRDRAEGSQGLGIGMIAVGGAALALGTTMAILNAPRKKLVEKRPAPSVGASVTERGLLVTLSGSF